MFSAAELTACDPRIYVSFLDSEAREEAIALQDTLHEKRSCAVYCDPFRADDQEAAQNARTAIHIADLVVVLGTKMYGKRTAECFSTHDELHYIVRAGKPVLFVQMCKALKYLPTRWLCSQANELRTLSWAPHLAAQPHLARVSPPAALLEEIVRLGRYWNSREQPCALAPTPPQRTSTGSASHRGSDSSRSSTSSSASRRSERAASQTSSRASTPRHSRPPPSPSSHQLRWTRRKRSMLPSALSAARENPLVPADDVLTLNSRVWSAVEGLRSHFDNPEIQLAHLGALVSCVADQGPSTAVPRLLAQMAGFDVIASVMAAHPDHRRLQCSGCRILKHTVTTLAQQRALHNAAAVNPSALTEEEVEEGKETGGQEARVKALNPKHKGRHPPSPIIKDCLDESAVDRIMTKSARAALKAMTTHERDADVQTYGCQLIHAMARHTEHTYTHVLRTRAVGAVIRAMGRHGTDGDVQRAAALAFAALAAQNEAMQRLVRDGGVSTLVAMLRRPVQCTEAIEVALECLQLLGSYLQRKQAGTKEACATKMGPSHPAAQGTTKTTVVNNPGHIGNDPTASSTGKFAQRTRSEGNDSGSEAQWWEAQHTTYSPTYSCSRKGREQTAALRSSRLTVDTRVTDSVARAVDCILAILHEHKSLEGVQRTGVAALMQLLPLLPRSAVKEREKRAARPRAVSAPGPRDLYPQLFVALHRLEDAPPTTLLEDHLSSRLWHV